MKSLVLYLDSSQLFTFFLRNESVEGCTEVSHKSPETEVISFEVMSPDIFSKWSEMLSFVAGSFKRY